MEGKSMMHPQSKTGLLLAFLLFLVACGGQQSGTTQPANPVRAVQVTITNQRIEASVTTFNVNTSYQFTVVNKADTPADFLIRELPLVPEGSATAQKGVLYEIPSTRLPPGGTQHFTFAFPVTAPQSNLEMASNLPGPGGHGKVPLPIQAVLGK